MVPADDRPASSGPTRFPGLLSRSADRKSASLGRPAVRPEEGRAHPAADPVARYPGSDPRAGECGSMVREPVPEQARRLRSLGSAEKLNGPVVAHLHRIVRSGRPVFLPAWFALIRWPIWPRIAAAL